MSYWQCMFCGDTYDPTDPAYESLDEWRFDHDYDVEEIHE